jgi:hypothetical protein
MKGLSQRRGLAMDQRRTAEIASSLSQYREPVDSRNGLHSKCSPSRNR